MPLRKTIPSLVRLATRAAILFGFFVCLVLIARWHYQPIKKAIASLERNGYQVDARYGWSHGPYPVQVSIHGPYCRKAYSISTVADELHVLAPYLEGCSFPRGTVSDDTIRLISQISGLKRLMIHAERLSLAGRKQLGQLRQLETLHVIFAGPTVDDLSWLNDCTKLKKLSIQGANLDNHLLCGSGSQKLECLMFWSCSLQTHSLSSLEQATELRSLRISECRCEIGFCEQLEKLKALESISITTSLLEDELCKSLGNLPKLESASFSGICLSDQDIQNLVRDSHSLTSLDLWDVDLTVEAFCMSDAQAPLFSIWFPRSSISGSDLVRIAEHYPTLRRLCVGRRDISEENEQRLNEILEQRLSRKPKTPQNPLRDRAKRFTRRTVNQLVQIAKDYL